MSPADDGTAVGKQELRAVLNSHRGRVGTDLRFWFVHRFSGLLQAGLRGVTIPATEMPWLIRVLQAQVNYLVECGYMTIDKATGHVTTDPSVFTTKDW